MKINNTINKVLAELKSDKPDLSYIRGLLEGLVEEEEVKIYQTRDEEVVGILKNGFPGVVNTPSSSGIDEGSIMDSVARANLNRIKNLAEASQE